MVQIAGKYQFVESKNFYALLVGIGIDAAKAKVAAEGREGFEVRIDGNKITIIHDGPRDDSNVTLGEYEETLPNGIDVKSFATLEGDVLNVTSKTKDSKSAGSRTYTFTDSGLNLVVTASGIDGKTYSATANYKRV